MKKLFLFLLVGMFMLSCVSAFDWADGIESYYKLDESSGAVIDSIDNFNGVNNGATAGATGKISTAYDFENTESDYISTLFNTSLTTFTVSTWIKAESDHSGFIIGKDTNTGNRGWALGTNTDTDLLPYFEANGVAGIKGTTTLSTGTWYHLAVTSENGKQRLYLNGVNEVNNTLTINSNNDTIAIGRRNYPGAESYFDGVIDEVGIWDRVLNTSEILELYNSGAGLAYGGSEPIAISLESPINQTIISDIGNNFIVYGSNLSTVSGTWNNVTYYVWDGDGVIHNTTTVELNNESFNETLFIDDFTLGNYTWNAKGIYTNSTDTYEVWGLNNFTFSVVPFSTISTQYSPTVLEGSSNIFSTNISIISTERMSTVYFIYNNTSYLVSPIEYDTNEWYMPYNLTIPEVSENENKTFYWSIRLESGLVYNTTSINQTIYNIGIDDCSSYTYQLFNLTIKDETDQSILVGATDNTSIKISIILSSSLNNEIVNFSKNYDKTNPARVCLNYLMDNSTLNMDAVIEYSAAERFVEFYNIQDYVLTNSTQSQEIFLYNLKEDVGQEFKLTYKGLDFVPVSDLIVQIQRKYIDEGVFKTIEIPMSGTNGFTIAHLVPNDIIYNLIFIKNGVILDTFTDVIAVCQNPTFTDCEINLNALVTGTDLFGLIEEEDFFSSLSYNPSTRTISSTYGILSGVSGTTALQVYLLDNFGTTQICNDSLIAAGGTLSCVVPESFGNGTIQAKILLNGDIRREGFISMDQKPKVLYEGILIFVSIIMFMFLIGIGIQENPMIMGIFLILGLIILVSLNLVYTTSWIGVGASILWFIVAVVMVLIKGGNKR